jgi:hypothetical protein
MRDARAQADAGTEVACRESWGLSNDTVSLYVSKRGGMMAPVNFFHRASAPFQPYYISPWQCEDETPDDPVLQTLRGDFFCMPFGAGGTFDGETHTAHGETAAATWHRDGDVAEDGRVRSMDLSLRASVRPGTVRKRISLVEGHSAVYIRHVLEGFSGEMPLGHHATLKGAPENDPALVATSPLRFGITAPREPLYFADGEYYALQPLSEFTSLRKVPTVWRDTPITDISVFPSRPGFVDIAQVFYEPGTTPVWTTVTFPSEEFLWYSLKDPRVLPSTVLWMENRGRHQAPWNGRNSCLGLEDVCSFVAEGLAPSVADNPVRARGVPTCVALAPERELVVTHIQGAVPVPAGFGRVAWAEFVTGEVLFTDEAGSRVTAPVAHEFIWSGVLSV